MIVSVVMPVYNECGTLEQIVRRVFEAPIPHQIELIIVDDGSTDGTHELYPKIKQEHAEKNIVVIELDVNRGKGAALRTGFLNATGEVVLIQDADLEYNPQDYPKLLRPIEQGRADVVYGSRFIGQEHRVLFFWHYVGNKLLTLLSNVMTNLNLTDMETCYKVFRRDLLMSISLKQNRFGFEPEVTAKIARTGCRIYEVAINYDGRDYSQGKKITWRDGVKAFYCIIRYALTD